jgi:hypothetical protein
MLFMVLAMGNGSFAQMKCGDSIISVGDSMSKVKSKCGRPTYTSHDFDGGRRGRGPNTYYYSQGEGKHMKKIFVQGGRIDRIEWLDKEK